MLTDTVGSRYRGLCYRCCFQTDIFVNDSDLYVIVIIFFFNFNDNGLSTHPERTHTPRKGECTLF